MTNKEKSEEFYKAGFWVAGQGHFNIYVNELEIIFDFLDKNDIQGLKTFYEQLAKDRLG